MKMYYNNLIYSIWIFVQNFIIAHTYLYMKVMKDNTSVFSHSYLWKSIQNGELDLKYYYVDNFN